MHSKKEHEVKIKNLEKKIKELEKKLATPLFPLLSLATLNIVILIFVVEKRKSNRIKPQVTTVKILSLNIAFALLLG